jgi:hypothetical protein
MFLLRAGDRGQMIQPCPAASGDPAPLIPEGPRRNVIGPHDGSGARRRRPDRRPGHGRFQLPRRLDRPVRRGLQSVGDQPADVVVVMRGPDAPVRLVKKTRNTRRLAEQPAGAVRGRARLLHDRLDPAAERHRRLRSAAPAGRRRRPPEDRGAGGAAAPSPATACATWSSVPAGRGLPRLPPRRDPPARGGGPVQHRSRGGEVRRQGACSAPRSTCPPSPPRASTIAEVWLFQDGAPQSVSAT